MAARTRPQTITTQVTVVGRAPVKKSSRRNADVGFDELRRRLQESNDRLRYVSSSARATAVPRQLANVSSTTRLPPTMYERDTMRPTAAGDLEAGRVAFTGVSHEQQRVQKHQQLRQARLEQLEAARRAAEDAASRRKQAAKTAQTEATVEHLAETAASHMTSSVNEALATYCAFEELPMYTPAQRGVDGRVALGYTFPGMPEHRTPSLSYRPERIIATRSLWNAKPRRVTGGGSGPTPPSWAHPFMHIDDDARESKDDSTLSKGAEAGPRPSSSASARTATRSAASAAAAASARSARSARSGPGTSEQRVARMLSAMSTDTAALDAFKAQVDENLAKKHKQVTSAAAAFQRSTGAAARQLVRDLDTFSYEMAARYKAKFDAVETTMGSTSGHPMTVVRLEARAVRLQRQLDSHAIFAEVAKAIAVGKTEMSGVDRIFARILRRAVQKGVLLSADNVWGLLEQVHREITTAAALAQQRRAQGSAGVDASVLPTEAVPPPSKRPLVVPLPRNTATTAAASDAEADQLRPSVVQSSEVTAAAVLLPASSPTRESLSRSGSRGAAGTGGNPPGPHPPPARGRTVASTGGHRPTRRLHTEQTLLHTPTGALSPGPGVWDDGPPSPASASAAPPTAFTDEPSSHRAGSPRTSPRGGAITGTPRLAASAAGLEAMVGAGGATRRPGSRGRVRRPTSRLGSAPAHTLAGLDGSVRPAHAGPTARLRHIDTSEVPEVESLQEDVDESEAVGWPIVLTVPVAVLLNALAVDWRLYFDWLSERELRHPVVALSSSTASLPRPRQGASSPSLPSTQSRSGSVPGGAEDWGSEFEHEGEREWADSASVAASITSGASRIAAEKVVSTDAAAAVGFSLGAVDAIVHEQARAESAEADATKAQALKDALSAIRSRSAGASSSQSVERLGRKGGQEPPSTHPETPRGGEHDAF